MRESAARQALGLGACLAEEAEAEVLDTDGPNGQAKGMQIRRTAEHQAYFDVELRRP